MDIEKRGAGLRKPLMSEEPPKDESPLIWVRLILTVVSVSLGSSLQFGYATGSLNNLEQIVPQALADAGSPITMAHWAFINSCFSIGGIAGSYGVVAPLAYFGRKKTLLMANVFVFLSSMFMFYGTTWYMLVAGRICVGIVAGVAQMVAGAYMTEISPVGIRGSVGVCSQVGIVCGIALANLLTAPSFNIFGSLEKWRYTFLVPSAFSVFQLIVLPFCPESPAFLIKSQGEKATFETLMKLHRELSASQHLHALKTELQEGGKSGDDMSLVELLTARNLRKQVMVACVIKVGVQFSGIDAIFYYSTLMFRHANVADPQLATFLLSMVNLAMTFVAMAFMDIAGRKPLLMVTWIGMACGFFTIFAVSTLGESFFFFPELMSNIAVVAMVCIIVCFAVGVGNVEGFIISEIMPVYAKDTMMSLAQPLNWVSNLTVSTFFPIIFASLGRNTYLIFVVMLGFFGVFTYYKLPETKGKTQLVIAKEFEKKY